MDKKIALGTHLRKCRKAKNMTQEKLAELTSLHPTYVGQLERGKQEMSISTLVKISGALGTSPGFFITKALGETEHEWIEDSLKHALMDNMDLIVGSFRKQLMKNDGFAEFFNGSVEKE